MSAERCSGSTPNHSTSCRPWASWRGFGPARCGGPPRRERLFDRNLIHVCESVRNSRLELPYNGKVCDALVLDSLRPVLERCARKAGDTGLIFRPSTKRGGRPGKPPTYIQEHTMKRHLVAALTSCKLPAMTWYEATRHTFASQWVLEGKPIGRLARMLGGKPR